MTKFNPENKPKLTYDEALGPAMEITDQSDADQYKSDYVAFIKKILTDGNSDQGHTAEQIANTNLGYYAGYYSNEVRQRVELLFKCSHPVFGAMKNNGVPTEDEAYKCGTEGKKVNEIRN